MKKNVDVEMAVAEKEDDRETEESLPNRTRYYYCDCEVNLKSKYSSEQRSELK